MSTNNNPDVCPDDLEPHRSADAQAMRRVLAERAAAARNKQEKQREEYEVAVVMTVLFLLVAIAGPVAIALSKQGANPLVIAWLVWVAASVVVAALWFFAREGKTDPRWQRIAAYHKWWASGVVVGLGVFASVAGIAQAGMADHTWAWRIALAGAAAVAVLVASGLYGCMHPSPDVIREQRLAQIWRGVVEVIIAIILTAILLSSHGQLIRLHKWEVERQKTAAQATTEQVVDPVPAEALEPHRLDTSGGLTVDPGPGAEYN